MTCRRGTSNSNQRGNAESRRARKQYLLHKHGDGTTAPCYRCGEELDASNLTVDRIIAGLDGGTYERSNIRPACASCNIITGNLLRDHRRRFPKGAPVRFASSDAGVRATLYDVVDGESEHVLTLRSRRTGRTYAGVTRDRITPPVSTFVRGRGRARGRWNHFLLRALCDAGSQAACS